jgi:hypothetical protein
MGVQAGRHGLLRPAAVREQRLRALGRANEVRVARARLKRELAAGTVTLEQVVAHPPACAGSAKVCDLLKAVPGIGPVRTNKLLLRCRIPHEKALDTLSDRQRSVLIASLADAASVSATNAIVDST